MEIEDLARKVAEKDPKYEKEYDELPFHQQLSCRAMARYILEIIEE